MVDRRQFLQAGALAAGMAALPGVQARTVRLTVNVCVIVR